MWTANSEYAPHYINFLHIPAYFVQVTAVRIMRWRGFWLEHWKQTHKTSTFLRRLIDYTRMRWSGAFPEESILNACHSSSVIHTYTNHVPDHTNQRNFPPPKFVYWLRRGIVRTTKFIASLGCPIPAMRYLLFMAAFVNGLELSKKKSWPVSIPSLEMAVAYADDGQYVSMLSTLSKAKLKFSIPSYFETYFQSRQTQRHTSSFGISFPVENCFTSLLHNSCLDYLALRHFVTWLS